MINVYVIHVYLWEFIDEIEKKNIQKFQNWSFWDFEKKKEKI